MNKYCYMTLMTTEKFLPCVIRCHESLQYVKSKYPYVVLIPENNLFLKTELQKRNILFKEIKVDKLDKNRSFYYNDTINKFQLFNFIEYDKIFFLDADSIVCQNIDLEFNKLKDKEKIYLYSEDFQDRKRLTGSCFIVKPNPLFYNKILQLITTEQFYNDEQIIDHFFIDQEGLRSPPEGFLHFGGFIKPWENLSEDFNFLHQFFTSMPLEKFYYYLDNTQEFLGIYNQWSCIYNKISNFGYVICIKNENDLKQGLKIQQQMKDYGFLYQLIFITEKKKEIIDKLHNERLSFSIVDKIPDNLIDILCLYSDLFYGTYSSLLIIQNLNICIKNNFDFIFKEDISLNVKNSFYEQYKNFIYKLNFL